MISCDVCGSTDLNGTVNGKPCWRCGQLWLEANLERDPKIIICPVCGTDHTERGQMAASIECSCGHHIDLMGGGIPA